MDLETALVKSKHNDTQILVYMLTYVCNSLAWAEMRVLLANLLWNFDIELLAGHDWPESNKIYSTWEKPNLKVRLTPRQT
jgi:hypothetical protein